MTGQGRRQDWNRNQNERTSFVTLGTETWRRETMSQCRLFTFFFLLKSQIHPDSNSWLLHTRYYFILFYSKQHLNQQRQLQSSRMTLCKESYMFTLCPYGVPPGSSSSLHLPKTSWIDDSTLNVPLLRMTVWRCIVWRCSAINCYPIQGVFSPHAQCSRDKLLVRPWPWRLLE